jgi:hypothetical protein
VFRARVDPAIRPGVVAVPHGWGGEAGVGRLTSATESSCDPLTGMVQQSGVAVTISPA